MNSRRYCRLCARRAASSFYLPMRLLDRERREAMFALYAYCREVDDLVDGEGRGDQAEQRLAQWEAELHASFAGTPRHPVTQELMQAMTRFQLPTQPFFDLLDGMRMDLASRSYHTLEELETYCDRVAVTVGRLAVRVFLGPGPLTPEVLVAGERYAHHLGQAFQLTNILRDVAADAHLGRVYIPREFLAAAGLDEVALLQGRAQPGLDRALLPLAQAADRHYLEASRALSLLPRSLLWPAQAMAAVYQAYLRRLGEGGFQAFGAPVTLSWREKLSLTLSAWWQAHQPQREAMP